MFFVTFLQESYNRVVTSRSTSTYQTTQALDTRILIFIFFQKEKIKIAQA